MSCTNNRSTHTLGKPKCHDCCTGKDSYSCGPDVDTRINVVKYKTYASCCFSTIDLAALYNGTDPSPSAAFVTDPDVPSAVTIPPPELAKGAVFLATSFTTTNMYDGTTTGYIPLDNPVEISVSHPTLMPLLPNVITDDTPMIELSGNYGFGSFDLVLQQIFNQIDGIGGGFSSLTNPNEFELGDPNIVQIIWPEHLDWEFTFISHDNIQYQYKSNSGQCGNPDVCAVIRTDLNADPPTSTTTTQSACSAPWAVPCAPTGYVTARQTFNFNFPPAPGISGPTGCTGVTGGLFCLNSFVIDNSTITFNKNCYCASFQDDTGLTGLGISGTMGYANETALVTMLNNLFTRLETLRGWKALPDIEYGYVRLVHPDNILQFALTFNKFFYGATGLLPACNQSMIFKQGARTEFVIPGPDLYPVITANNQCILDGFCWVMESDKNGYFLCNIPPCNQPLM